MRRVLSIVAVSVVGTPAIACEASLVALADDEELRKRIAVAEPDARTRYRELIGAADTLAQSGYATACREILEAVRDMALSEGNETVEDPAGSGAWEPGEYAKVAARAEPFEDAARRLSSDTLIGAEARLIDGTPAGSVVGFLSNHADGITKVIVNNGGFLGLGGRDVALPIGQLLFDKGARLLFLDVTQAWLEDQPDWERESWVAGPGDWVEGAD